VAPVVSLTGPANNAVFAQGSTITLSADATDSDGTVAKVEFYAGATLLNSDTAAPYSFAWTNAAVGTHSLTAKAYDNAGAVTTSAAANITVNSVASGNGLLGSYFGNLTLSGAPLLQRVEAVAFSWGTAAPAPNVPADGFSVRWTGKVLAPSSGNYTFGTYSDDGVRLWVNGVLLVDNWTDHNPTLNSAPTMALTAGQWYPVTLEYYDRGGSALIHLGWQTPQTPAFAPVPAANLAP
jgi:hypothetical protein